MMRPASRALGAAALALGSSLFLVRTEAKACGNGKILFEDRFATLDPSWNFVPQNPDRTNGPEGLVYHAKPSWSFGPLNQSGVYDDYEVCAVFTTDFPADGHGWAGVEFWGSDQNNYYDASIFPVEGSFGVWRTENNKSLNPIHATESKAIHKGTSVTNEISVTVNSQKATLAINGEKVIDFSGRPPDGGSLIGFTMGTGSETGPSTFTVKSIQVRVPDTSLLKRSSLPSAAAQQ